MQEATPTFSVTVETRVPPFDTERLFVINEKKHARRELARLKERHPVLAAVLPVLGSLKAKDWKHYLEALNHYWEKLDHHEEEIIQGMVPVKFFVINNGAETDEAIRIRVQVENGTIHPAKEAPVRPVRIDGGQHVADPEQVTAPMVPPIGRFSRRGIKVTPHAVEAEFSMLEGHDSADLVRQVLYVDVHDDTRLTYEIRSKRMKEVQGGEVEF